MFLGPILATLIIVGPGDDVAARVASAPPGTQFLFTSGTYRRLTITPKDGMSFTGEEGAVLDGENAAPRAFIGQGINNVTIRGLRITRYRPAFITAALDGIDSEGWTVEDTEIDHNSDGHARVYGLRIGSRWLVRRNRIHDNGWVGIEGYNATDTVIEFNDIYANPSAWFDDRIGEAANIKLYGCGRIIIRGNRVHDGPLRGIWIDRSRPDITIEDNRVVSHGDAGIWYEASDRGRIAGNYVERAGMHVTNADDWLRGGGIQVTNSLDVSVLDNVVINSHNGIIGLQASGYTDGAFGRSELRNLLVEHNTIVMPSGQTGIMQNTGSDDVFTSWNNRFRGNHYDVSGNPAPFRWMHGAVTARQWRLGVEADLQVGTRGAGERPAR
jgi:parallel beta-helix repeat protein